jgi:C_GCAxxG_C_C family probable redox protein
MGHLEEVKTLRADTQQHYNCAQAILVAFSDELGMTKEDANRLGAMFGSGMLHGSTCGTISAAFMILGKKGYEKTEAGSLLREFVEKHGSTHCSELLASSQALGIPRKQHCDGLVFEMTEYLDRLFEENGKEQQ